jgi:hypothetical protein
MMKDLASATLSPPSEFTADSYLMRNYQEFPKSLYFGRETGLNFGGHGAVCNPIESGDSGSMNGEIPFEDHVRFKDRWMVASWCDE